MLYSNTGVEDGGTEGHVPPTHNPPPKKNRKQIFFHFGHFDNFRAIYMT